MRALGEYHSRDIHEWDGGECGFHPKIVCSCKKCKEDEELQCQGKPYKTKNPLTCDYHWLQYCIECERRVEDADSVIHPTMGRGHSNLCDAHFIVLPDYRAKDQNLCRYVKESQAHIGMIIWVGMKVAQAEDQEARKKWVKQQAVRHTYGNDKENDDAEEYEVDPALIVASRAAMKETEEDDGAILVISGRTCRCGSKTHRRVCHSDCPLNPRNKN